MLKQLNPKIAFFDQNINLCKVVRNPNIFAREFFKRMIKDIQFEVKCPFKKGVYRRDPIEIFNLSTTLAADKRLSVPSFINYDKEFMIKMTFTTRVNGYQEQIADIEETNKFVDVTY